MSSLRLGSRLHDTFAVTREEAKCVSTLCSSDEEDEGQSRVGKKKSGRRSRNDFDPFKLQFMPKDQKNTDGEDATERIVDDKNSIDEADEAREEERKGLSGNVRGRRFVGIADSKAEDDSNSQELRLEKLENYYKDQLNKVHRDLQRERANSSSLSREIKRYRRKNNEMKHEVKRLEMEYRAAENSIRNAREETKRAQNKARAGLEKVRQELRLEKQNRAVDQKRADEEKQKYLKSKKNEKTSNSMSMDELSARMISKIHASKSISTLETAVSACEEASKIARRALSDSLKAHREELKERRLCRICLDKPCERLFLPCCHFVCCQKCTGLIKTCPVCREKIAEVKPVYS